MPNRLRTHERALRRCLIASLLCAACAADRAPSTVAANQGALRGADRPSDTNDDHGKEVDDEDRRDDDAWRRGRRKGVVPAAYHRVVDRAIQVWGAAGVSGDLPLAGMYQGARTLRLADGPDEVHKILIAKNVMSSYHTGQGWDFGN